MKQVWLFNSLLILTVCFQGLALGQQIPPNEALIKPDGSGDYPTIQEGINAVADGGTVLLADGVFSGPGNMNLVFPGTGLTLKSQNLNRENCIIDCIGDRGLERMSAFVIEDLVDGPAIMSLTVRNGSAAEGGGAYVSNSQVAFVSVLFEDNQAGSEGAALYCENSDVFVSNCWFFANASNEHGGAIQLRGVNQETQVSNCQFENNSAGVGGGAIDIFDGPDLLVEFSVFRANSAEGQGGAIADWDAGSTTLVYVTLAENSGHYGGAVYAANSAQLDIDACIVAHSLQGSAVYIDPVGGMPDATIHCTDIWGNAGGDWTWPISEWWEGESGNIQADPQFCGELGSGNLFLQSDSPCAEGNNDCSLTMGMLPVNCDETLAATTTWSRLKSSY